MYSNICNAGVLLWQNHECQLSEPKPTSSQTCWPPHKWGKSTLASFLMGSLWSTRQRRSLEDWNQVKWFRTLVVVICLSQTVTKLLGNMSLGTGDWGCDMVWVWSVSAAIMLSATTHCNIVVLKSNWGSLSCECGERVAGPWDNINAPQWRVRYLAGEIVWINQFEANVG